jgi:hypothetical protein
MGVSVGDQLLIIILLDFCLLNNSDFQLKQNEISFLKAVFEQPEVYDTEYPVRVVQYIVENLETTGSYDEPGYILELQQLFADIFRKFSAENKTSCMEFL